ncbi:MAG: hypothetical protein RLY97_1639 [Pseudomonadota bacterium]|jgi:two-component system, LytTR family, sensor kinase
MIESSSIIAPVSYTPRVSFRAVLGSIMGLWLCYFALITLRSLLIDSEYFAEMAAHRLVVVSAGIVITGLAWVILRLFDARALGWRIAAALVVMIPAALVLAMVNQRVFADLDQRIIGQVRNPSEVQIRHDTAGNILIDLPDPPGLSPDQLDALQQKMTEHGWWQQTTDIAIGRYFLLLAWAALYFALAYAAEARLAERREGEFRRAAKAAELQSLRYQINPHFLFNTLNSLSALVITKRADAAEEMIQTLSIFYRRSLAGDPTAEVTLREEIALQQLYLKIEEVRFPKRLRAEYAIPAYLENAKVPGMILQPLVENSVKYAVAPSQKPTIIWIEAKEEAGELHVIVRDNGKIDAGKVAQEKPANHGFGIGLANVRDRLAALFGDRAAVESGPTDDGYRTVIRLPLNV